MIKQSEVTDLLSRCSYRSDPSEFRAAVLSQIIDVTDRISAPLGGLMLGMDGSTYEASVEKRFPSVRMGLVKLGHFLVDVSDYIRVGAHRSMFADPIAVARLERERQTYSIPLTGAGISLDGASARSSFRRSVFEAFRSKQLELLDRPMTTTLLDLCAYLVGGSFRIDERDGVRHMILCGTRTCPVTGEPLGRDVVISETEGWAPCPHDENEPIYLTDVLRLGEAFAEEGSNQQAYTRSMNVLEHLLLAHFVMSMSANPVTAGALEDFTILMDGPLALFGEPASFHGAIMKMLHDLRTRRPEAKLRVVGVAKTGRVVEHGHELAEILQGERYRDCCLVLPISDEYRYRYIDYGAKDPSKNHGAETYYGQPFLVRGTNGAIYELHVAYPFARKGAGFQQAKMDLDHYEGVMMEAISLLELFGTPLWENANIVQHLAHKTASIAERPAGRTLDAFIRSVLTRR
ncbi:MAG: hypothetical protein AAF368_00185 [Planctomycetota bacterium]